MSFKATTLVQDRTRAKGSNLYVLGIIADYAKDDGRWAWPHPSTIAWKARLTPRAAELILRKLVVDGELLPEWDAKEKRLYLHVRCISEWEAYQAEGAIPDREKISRKTSAAFALRLVDLAATSAKSRAANAKSCVQQPEDLCAQREKSCAEKTVSDGAGEGSRSQPLDPLIDPLGIEQGAPPPMSRTPPERTPEDNLVVITRLAHEVLALHELTPDVSERDIVDSVELRCSSEVYDIAHDRDVVYRAIAAAVYQRRLAGKPPVLANSPGDAAFRMKEVH